jgi:hypothetical protein
MLSIYFTIWGLLALEPVTSSAVEATNFYELTLENLGSFSTFKTETMTGKFSLWVLFQPNCASCKRQLNDLECLPSDIAQIAVGIGGNQDQLNKEILPSKFQGQRVLASPQLKRAINTQATPSLFLVNKSGQVEKRIQGATDCEAVKSAFGVLR